MNRMTLKSIFMILYPQGRIQKVQFVNQSSIRFTKCIFSSFRKEFKIDSHVPNVWHDFQFNISIPMMKSISKSNAKYTFDYVFLSTVEHASGMFKDSRDNA